MSCKIHLCYTVYSNLKLASLNFLKYYNTLRNCAALNFERKNCRANPQL